VDSFIYCIRLAMTSWKRVKTKTSHNSNQQTVISNWRLWAMVWSRMNVQNDTISHSSLRFGQEEREHEVGKE
jgi:hypothetical protein